VSKRHFAVCCDLSGRIRSVLRDDLGLLNSALTTALLPAIVTPSSSAACFAMLETVRREQSIYGWMLEVQTESGPVSLHFAGAIQDEQILLIASEDLGDMPGFTEDLMRVNNEHVATLRRLMKEAAVRARSEGQYPALTELNNAVTSLQRQLASRTEQLERTLWEKNLLLGLAAHDLRGPISAIARFAYVLNASPQLEDRQRAYCDRIEHLCGHMSRLLNGVLSVAAIESGELQLEKTRCELSAVIDGAVECVEPMAEMLDVRIQVATETPNESHNEPRNESSEKSQVASSGSAAKGSTRCLLDKTRMVQAIANLIENAIKAAPKGTAVVISAQVSDSMCHITVRDHGPGIAEDRRDEIFRAFKTAREGDQKTTSFGLGLAITQRIVHEHNGMIQVDCPADGGTAFHVIVPQS
jgi:signal transduction histidine kinase